MAKRIRKGRLKDKNKLIKIEICLTICIVLLSLISIFFIMQIPKKQYEYESLNNKYSYKKKEYEKKIIEYRNLVNEMDKYSDIDKAIENTKNEYFTKIKQLEDDILAGKSNKKIAYLTFDDGPYYNTYRVFDILDKYNVKATFFTTNINGEYCFDNKSENCWIRYNEYLERGHTLANHTYSHAIFRGLYNSTDSFINSVVMQEDLIRQQTGYTTNIVRFPGGSVTAKGLKDPIIEELRNRGYGWVDWTALDGDGNDIQNAEQAWSILTNSLDENIEVILLHDYNAITTSILEDVIIYLQDNGYILLPLFYESNMINK